VRESAANPSTLANMPPEIQRARLLDSAQAAEFWGVSLPHWRRLYREKQVPRGILIGKRKLGWRVGDLIDEVKRRDADHASDPGGASGSSGVSGTRKANSGVLEAEPASGGRDRMKSESAGRVPASRPTQ
jgi:predicted DNA-binding transcriptional regulator AlpA